MSKAAPNSRGKILFGDDDELVRDGLAELLRRRDFECVCASTGAEALEHLRGAEFDALLSDIHMPGNVGLELIASIPQIAEGLPVVLLTGRPSVETAARSVRLSVAAYLTKPPDLDELCAILDQAITAHRGFRAMRAGRERLHEWEQELERIEAVLRKSPASSPGGPIGSYLRLSLRHVILILSDLEHATDTLERPGVNALDQVDHVAALRRTVQVLERTRQNFKSRELADLRHQIEELLVRNETPPTG
jgi:CheY-like chemotaxis protein